MGPKKRGIASVLSSTSQKYRPSDYAQWRTLKRVTKLGTSILSLIDKQPLRRLDIYRQTPK
jgi:hypothetical protein